MLARAAPARMNLTPRVPENARPARQYFIIILWRSSSDKVHAAVAQGYGAAMPRYFFHFSDGKRTFTDTKGVELFGLAAARAHAAAQIRDMRVTLSGRSLQDWAGWKIIAVDAKGASVAVLFASSQSELVREFRPLAKALPQKTALWIAWPKKASGVATDLTENVVREFGLTAGWVDYKVCAIDETWSGLCFARRK